MGDCASCDAGWGAVPDCDSCFEGYAGDDCDECVDGWYRPVPGGGCVRCAATAGCNTVVGATLAAACPDFVATSAPTCVCGAGYGGPLCGDCVDGYTGFAFLHGQCFLCTPALLSCDATGSNSALCLSSASSPSGVALQQCVCTHELMVTPTCDACAAGYAKHGATCLTCAAALGCSDLGTLSAACPNGRAVSADADARCACREGYTGPACDACDAAAGYVSSGGVCTSCNHDCGVYGVASCDTGAPTCVCTHGREGALCDACDPDACGEYGTCAGNATHPAATWCTCDAGYAVNAVAAAGDPDNAHALPCDSCDNGGGVGAGDAVWTPASTGIADRYGAGVHACLSAHDTCAGDGGSDWVDVGATVAAGDCVCALGLNPPSAGNGWRCTPGDCAPGYVGPGCAPCPSCPAGAECRAAGSTATCVCTNGFSGEACAGCGDGALPRPAGVSAALVPASCTPCPDCGNGTCVWTQGYVAGCACAPPTAHAVRGDVTSPCTGCVQGRSPLTCGPCPACAYGEVCVEEAPGAAGCACRTGTRRVRGYDTAGTHHCVATALADAAEAIPGVNLATFVDSILLAGASTGAAVAVPEPRPVFALAPAEDLSLASVAGVVSAVGAGAFSVGVGIGVLLWWAVVGVGPSAAAAAPPPMSSRMGTKAGVRRRRYTHDATAKHGERERLVADSDDDANSGVVILTQP